MEKSGYLQVFTSKGVWVPFWFVCHGGFITAYPNPTNLSVPQLPPISLYQAVVAPDPNNNAGFMVTTQDKKLTAFLLAESESAKGQWILALQSVSSPIPPPQSSTIIATTTTNASPSGSPTKYVSDYNTEEKAPTVYPEFPAELSSVMSSKPMKGGSYLMKKVNATSGPKDFM